MKAREPRRKVMINAEMRAGASWGDVCILDISPRGLLIQAIDPPARGTYVDVRRGPHAFVARVVWVKDHRFGVRTQDRLPVDEIVKPVDASTTQLVSAVAAGAAADRRSAHRLGSVRHEASRMMARSIQFAFVALFAAFGAVKEMLARPLAQLSAELAPR